MLGSTVGIDNGDTLGTDEGTDFGYTLVTTLVPTDGVFDILNDSVLERSALVLPV